MSSGLVLTPLAVNRVRDAILGLSATVHATDRNDKAHLGALELLASLAPIAEGHGNGALTLALCSMILVMLDDLEDAMEKANGQARLPAAP